MADDEVAVTTIDPIGDVILELSGPGGTIRLLVSSGALTLVSDYFAKMLSSQFKEGLHNRPAGQKHTVQLHEDDTEALTIVCNIIHHRTESVPRQLTAHLIKAIAVISDKYNIARAVSPFCEIWFQSTCESKNPTNLNRLLFMAYVLDNAYAFSRISWEILKIHTGAAEELRGMTDQDLVTHDIMRVFRKRKREVLAQLIDGIEERINLPLEYQCTGATKWTFSYLRKLKESPCHKLIQQKTMNATLFAALGFAEPERTSCRSANCAFCSDLTFLAGNIENLAKGILYARIGICLDCVKTNGEAAVNDQCRVKHT
ncbi:hypothetical protein MMC13_000807 [Lambiella insularis]|nr:hypothetical protein [Lambiella insularis]